VPWNPADLALLVLRVARGLELLAALSLFGTLFFVALIAWPHWHAAPALHSRLKHWLHGALALQLLAVVAWLLAQAQLVHSPQGLWHGLLLVGGQTLFGKALLLRSGLFVLAVGMATAPEKLWRIGLAVGLAACALLLQTRLGHTAAATGWRLPALLAIHVLAAGVWLGGLLPLLGLLGHVQGPAQLAVVRRFSLAGRAAVLALAFTASFMAWHWTGGLGGWFGTPYGLTALGKMLGLVLLLGCAAVNHWVFTPRLTTTPDTATRHLRLSIGLESLLGLLVIALAVLLATLPPGAHIQPEWPFAIQPDARAWALPWVPAEFRKLLVLLLVAVLGVAALGWRSTRVAGPVLALGLLWWLPSPNLHYFVQPAHAASFYRSETRYTASAIARGHDLVRQHCLDTCFATRNDPTNLTPYNIWQRSDGDFFDWLTRVFDRIGHSPLAHGTIAGFTDRERWQLVDYFRARVAGAAVQPSNRWPYAVPAPALSLQCHDPQLRQLGDLRGQLVHVVAVGNQQPAPAAIPALPGVRLTTVLLFNEDTATAPPPHTCHTTQPDAWTAWAIAGGRTPETLAGTAFLMDPQGWLRLRLLPEDGPSRPTSALPLEQAIGFILENPLPASTVGGHSGH
jgi:putative copper export protein